MKKNSIYFKTYLFLAILFLWQKGLAQIPAGNAGQHTAVSISANGNSMGFGYYEYLPTDFNASQTFPVVIFFHGLGERGNGSSDLNNLLMWGPPKAINEGQDFPSIIISPQTASTSPFTKEDFEAIYEHIVNNYPVDEKRIYVTGLSNGGGGTWNALSSIYYDKIAAAVPICGAATIKPDVTHLAELKNTPIWAHHSFDDTVIHRDSTRINVNRIAGTEAASESVMQSYYYGANNTVAAHHYTMQFDNRESNNSWFSDETEQIGAIQPQYKMAYTLYKDGAHGPSAWQRVYENQEVWDWLYAQNLDNLSVLDLFVKETNVVIHPNPTSGEITIQTTTQTTQNGKKEIQVYDMLGRKVLVKDFNLAESKLDLSTYGSGVYVLKIVGNTKDQYMTKVAVR